MNWAALLLIGLGVLGLGMAVTGGYAPLAKLLFGTGATPTQKPNTATNPIAPNTPNDPPPSGPRPHDPGVTLALSQLRAALTAYTPGSTL